MAAVKQHRQAHRNIPRSVYSHREAALPAQRGFRVPVFPFLVPTSKARARVGYGPFNNINR